MAFAVTNDFTNGTNADATEVNQNFAEIESFLNSTHNNEFGVAPIGSVIAWLKTFSSVSSGIATTDTLNKLVDTGATFQTDGVTAGMVVHNTTDDTYGIIDAVDSETSLSLRADAQEGSAVTDVFPDGNETYVVYATSELPDNWVQCNGQTLSDADSPYNGATIPDLNADAGTKRFLRGATGSGATGGSENHTHGTPVSATGTSRYSTTNIIERHGTTTDSTSTLPSYYEVVWIMRIK